MPRVPTRCNKLKRDKRAKIIKIIKIKKTNREKQQTASDSMAALAQFFSLNAACETH